MKETGLMFKAPLVRAILAGQKTQTRRLLKPWKGVEPSKKSAPSDLSYLPDFTCYRATCPMGQPGDRIYVRETWVDLIAVSPSSDEPMAIGPGERLIEAPTS
ncbi:hypothetical protein [Comamonas sp.]|uniref:hypothetical protein n=1 Tax=Comamonas sp. TaxID=34028 RepID=UPI00258C176D|nr:hypothetical protein [Comamonas sp.]